MPAYRWRAVRVLRVPYRLPVGDGGRVGTGVDPDLRFAEIFNSQGQRDQLVTGRSFSPVMVQRMGPGPIVGQWREDVATGLHATPHR